MNTVRTITFFVSFLFLSMLTIQYPLATTFPIGGDAPRYIVKLLEVNQELQQRNIATATTKLFTNTDYPGTQIILAVSQLLPISWPERFTWWIVLGYLTTGFTVGYLVHKIAGWQAGALSILAWAIISMAFTDNFIDGTLAQLLSLPPLLFALYAYSQRKWLIGSVLLVLTYLIHPLSIAPGVGTLVWVLLQTNLKYRQFFRTHWVITTAILLTLATLSYAFYQKVALVLTTYPASGEGVSVHDMLVSPIGPLLIIAPLGWLTLFYKKQSSTLWFATFSLISLLFFWHFEPLQGSLFLSRLQLYFAVSLAITAGIGLAALYKKLLPQSSLWQIIFITLLFMGLGLQTWQQNTLTFRFYESPSRYERVHITELAAFAWMNEHLAANQIVIATTANRHTEWIPALTSQKRVGLKENHEVFKSDPQTIQEVAATNHYRYAIFLKKQEKPAEVMPTIDSFPTIFENEGVRIIDLEML